MKFSGYRRVELTLKDMERSTIVTITLSSLKIREVEKIKINERGILSIPRVRDQKSKKKKIKKVKVSSRRATGNSGFAFAHVSTNSYGARGEEKERKKASR